MVLKLVKGFVVGYFSCNILIIFMSTQSDIDIRMFPLAGIEDREQSMFRYFQMPPLSNTFTHKPRVLCLVMTSPETISKRAINVKKTWARRCDKTVFFSTHDDPSFPCIGLNVTEGINTSWEKTKGAFLYIYKHYLDQFDWFIKADDDAYVIVENLRHFLSTKNYKQPVYYGHLLRDKQGSVTVSVVSGRSNYVLSRQSLLEFGVNMGNDERICPTNGLTEDLIMGNCLALLGLKAVEAVDDDGLYTFFCPDTSLHITGDDPFGYGKWILGTKQLGFGNVSRNAISFHFEEPWELYFFEYFVYRFSLQTDYGDSDNYIFKGNDWIEAPKTT